ncbi:type II secretion system protein [Candidatus Saccharibacteria bacterium]|nr:type II secretion system protein [Candidatus Saccharibacteria bacterium]
MEHKLVAKVTKQKGFTIVELMIATSIFTVAILLSSSVIIGISKTYQRASYTTKLNDASRNFHQDIKNAANQGNDVLPVINGSTKWICAGTTVYYWTESSDAYNNGGLYKLDNVSTCPTSPPSSGLNILPDGAYVYNSGADTSSPRTLTTNFGTGTADMHEESKLQKECLPTLSGGDFCAQVTYKSTIGNIRQ